MYERYDFFFHFYLLSCRYVMLQKSILSKPKWGGTRSHKGGHRPPGPTIATALLLVLNESSVRLEFRLTSLHAASWLKYTRIRLFAHDFMPSVDWTLMLTLLWNDRRSRYEFLGFPRLFLD